MSIKKLVQGPMSKVQSLKLSVPLCLRYYELCLRVSVVILSLCLCGSVFAEDAEIKLNSANGSTGLIIQDSAGVTVSRTDSDGNVVVAGTMTIQGNAFSVAGTTMVIVGGNVGVGAGDPGTKLEIRGDFASASNAELLRLNRTGNYNFGDQAGISIFNGSIESNRIVNYLDGGGPSTFGLKFYTYNAGLNSTPAVTIHPHNNVGINTPNPTTKFVVSNGSITVTGSNANLLVDGNVGIGTTGPGQKLDVVGSLKVDNNIYPGNQTMRYIYDNNVAGNYATRFSSAVIVDGNLSVIGKLGVHQVSNTVGTSTVTFSSSNEFEIVSTSILTEGGWIMIVYSPNKTNITILSAVIYYRLYRDSVLLKEIEYKIAGTSGFYYSNPIVYIDNPSAGTHTYSVKGQAMSGTTNSDCAGASAGQQRDLFLIELKK